MAYRQEQLKKKQDAQLKAFQRKVSAKIDEMRKQKVIELEKLLQRHQNARSDLEIQNKLEFAKLKLKNMNPFNAHRYTTTQRRKYRKNAKEKKGSRWSVCERSFRIANNKKF